MEKWITTTTKKRLKKGGLHWKNKIEEGTCGIITPKIVQRMPVVIAQLIKIFNAGVKFETYFTRMLIMKWVLKKFEIFNGRFIAFHKLSESHSIVVLFWRQCKSMNENKNLNFFFVSLWLIRVVIPLMVNLKYVASWKFFSLVFK